MIFNRLHRLVVRTLSPATGLAVTAVLLATGCHSEAPYVQLNMEGKRPYQEAYDEMDEAQRQNALTPEDHAQKLQNVANVLDAMFGTPDAPYAFPGTGLDQKKLALASGPTGKTGVVFRNSKNYVYSGQLVAETGAWFEIQEYGGGAITRIDRAGGEFHYQRGLFRQHCVHCHGINGDGAGPTAKYLMPYPRDYRNGTFKFTSTQSGVKATREDLMRTLLEGIPGTAMPSFRLLPKDELEALVEYVVYLSIRGEVETLITNRAFLGGEDLTDPSTKDAVIQDDLLDVAGRWQDAESHVIKPDLTKRPPVDTEEKLQVSIAEGRKLFFSKEAACFTCHGVTAMGDGWVPTPRWTGHAGDYFAKEAQLDEWNKKKVDANGDIVEHWEEMFKLPGQQVRPRNLRLGIYRGGNRPVDLFRRVYGGIKGSAMPNLGPAVGAQKSTLTETQIWHLVDYVRSLPYQPESETGLEQSSIVRPMQ